MALKLGFRKKRREQQIIFIRGFPRSGTNWLCNILNTSPKITCRGEFHLNQFRKRFEDFRDNDAGYITRNEEAKKKANELFDSFIEQYIIHFTGDTPIICDRTPIKLNSLLLPGKKYLIISRDGRDVLVSRFYLILKNKPDRILSRFPIFKELSAKLYANAGYFEDNPKELLSDENAFRSIASSWNDHILSDLDTCAKVDSKEIQIEYLWIVYEDLHTYFEEKIKEIYSFLGVSTHGLSFAKFTPGFNRHDPLSLYRKGSIGDWINYFTEENAKWFDEEAGEALDSLHYPRTLEIIGTKEI